MKAHRVREIGVVAAAIGIVLAGIAAVQGHAATKWKVDGSVEVSGTGETWAAAFKTIQEALDEAEGGDEIWVAHGGYAPTERYDPTVPESLTFNLKPEVGVYGGFLGNDHPSGGEEERKEREPEVNITQLKGALPGVQVYHVVRSEPPVDTTAVLSGFEVSGGSAVGPVSLDRSGGGMRIAGSNPVVARCEFKDNNAAGHGGGMFIELATFGQIVPTIIDCTFTGNTAGNGGGVGIADVFSNQQFAFTNCLFRANNAPTGGAIGLVFPFPTTLDINNCTIANNTASVAGGIFFIDDSIADIRNSILWGNADHWGTDEVAQLALGPGALPDPNDIVVRYTCLQGLNVFAGEGNIPDDPLFVQPPPPTPGNYRLTGASPCKDTGDPDPAEVPDDDYDIDDDFDFDEKTPDLDLNRRVVAGIVDMGAYEFFCEGDADDDGMVDVMDLLAVLGAWGPCAGCPEDLNHDGTVDVLDLLIVLADWGCPTYGQPPPDGIADCIARYGDDIEKMTACIETIILTEGQ